MQYTEFGKTGCKVSRLGFGCMRFPSYEKDGKKIFDEEESIRMMHRAMELGVNYFDTAPGYCDTISEIIVGKAMKNCRDKVYLSTKYPSETASGDDFEKRLAHSLKQLDTDYIDLFLIHEPYDEDRDMVRAMKEALEAGKIRALGISNKVSFYRMSVNLTYYGAIERAYVATLGEDAREAIKALLDAEIAYSMYAYEESADALAEFNAKMATLTEKYAALDNAAAFDKALGDVYSYYLALYQA